MIEQAISNLSQTELIKHINYLAKEIKRLEAAKAKAEITERHYSPRNSARSWTYSDAFDKAKIELKHAANHLI